MANVSAARLRARGRGAHRSRLGNLPAPISSFVGRGQAIADVKQALASGRLVTLIGTGGVGKTRLALVIAETVVEDYADGVWMVELAAVGDSQHVPQAFATTLNLKSAPGRPLDELLTAKLHDQERLLVIDNCEHVVAATARLVEQLLLACPALRILATSRQPLGVSGEVRWLVPALTLPPADLEPPEASQTGMTDVLGNAESVQLFVERATAAHAAFRLTAATSRAVERICRQLDGIPLALELAAAWTRVLSVDQVAAALSGSIDLLVSGTRTAAPRHQTLSATISWSYELLEHADQTLFEKLCVFRGGWTLEAARARLGTAAPRTPGQVGNTYLWSRRWLARPKLWPRSR